MPAEHWFDRRKSRTSRPPPLASAEEQHLDVLAADVAHHVGVGHVAHRTLHVRDRLHDVDVGPDRLLEHVGGVAGGPEPLAVQCGPERLHVVPNLGQDVLGVLDGVALRQGVGLVEHLPGVVVDEHRLAARGPAIETDDPLHHLTRLEGRGVEGGDPVLHGEGFELFP